MEFPQFSLSGYHIVFSKSYNKKLRCNFTIPEPFTQYSQYGLPTVFFSPPHATLFSPKKRLWLPYHNVLASSDFLTVVFFRVLLYNLSTFNQYGTVTRGI